MQSVRPLLYNPRVSRNFVAHSFICCLLCCVANAAPTTLERRQDDTAETPKPRPYDADVPNDPSFLPVQIGGIVGSYAASLVLVAAVLLFLSKRRREHLAAGDNEADFALHVDKPQLEVETHFPEPSLPPLSPRSIPRSPVNLHDFSPLSPFPHSASPVEVNPYVIPASPTSTVRSPLGIDHTVDQRVVAADREMAQGQLEEMYKYAFEQEEAKKKGIVLGAPAIPQVIPQSTAPRPLTAGNLSRPNTATTLTKKEKLKPAHLNLGDNVDEKHQSRTSSLFSALRSPKKKPKGISISSPIMTPMSGTFPRESQEMNTIPPRQYAPAPPPPVPTDQVPYRASRAGSHVMPLTPEYSPDSAQSIDERIGAQFAVARGGHSRNTSAAPTEPEANSAVSETSLSPLVGLPTSPKPGVTRFPNLPSSPKPGVGFAPLPLSPRPGMTFQRGNAPSAVRTGGSLPLRAYEPAMLSPSMSSQTTKQTVFERMGPLSPGMQTPYTGAAVPYSPYQPFSPCVPITPSLVTKADRKRMKRMEPKTPTVHMVQSADDIW